MQWFYAKGGEQVGPLEDHAFHELVRSNQITPDTPVWREGMPNWIPYGQISGRRPPSEPKKKLILARDAGGSEHEDAAGTATDGSADNAAGSDSANAAVVGSWIEPLYRAKGWIKFIGVLSILAGVLYAITLVGLVVAWLPIWMGVVLNGVAKNVALAYEGNDEIAAVTAMDKLRLYFKIMGVLAIISLVFGLGGFLLGIMLPVVFGVRQF